MPREVIEQNSTTFSVSYQRGLSAEQVALRQEEHLTNKTKKKVSKSYGRIIFDSFANPFNVLLIAVTGIMIWGQLSVTHFIFAAVFILNIAIGIYQDIHARKLIEKLQVLSDDKYTVIRDGEEVIVGKNDIVLSDILILKQGDQIPADCVLREGKCEVDESLLTGESIPTKKEVGDSLLSGTYVSSGRCYVETTKVGKDSYAEQLQQTASSFSRPKSQIAQTIWDITATCTIVALVFGIAYTVVAFWRAEISWNSLFPMRQEGTSFIEGLSGAMVAMLPTGMFLLTSIAMTTGVIALARKNMLVQELYCIEALARADVLCFDKTGTLTDGKMTVEEVLPFGGHDVEDVARGVASILNATGDDNATALALKDRLKDFEPYEVSQSLPFDSARKYSGVITKDGVGYVFGAYGFVPVEPSQEVKELLRPYEEEGYRCLVVGKRKNAQNLEDLQERYEICGVLVLGDHIKDDAMANIEWFQNAGVTVYVISGDNPVTVSEIAKRCGVNNADHYVDMSTVDDDDIPTFVKTCRVFGRVLPEQKRAIVKALKESGHKVAMTGDGVNDILALKEADCSIAMASGASAAKNVAHLICTKSDFSSLPDVVAQGRRVVNNLQRSCSLFLGKTVFAFLVSTAFLISVICGGKPYPFSTSHMLVWEILGIGIPSFFLALQPNAEKIKSGSMLGALLSRAIPMGLAEAMCVVIPFVFRAAIPEFISFDPAELYTVTVSMCIISFSTVCFWSLLCSCWPANRYRLTVFGLCFAVAILIFLIDFNIRTEDGKGVLLRFMWGGFSWSYPLLLLASLGASLGAYFLSSYLIDFFSHKPRRQKQ